MRIFLLTGEPSGDLHGAHLAQALYALHPDLEILGIGGTRMRQAGVSLLAESEHWGAIGIAEAVRKVPYLLGRLCWLVNLLRTDPPDVLVPIDFGAFNVALLHRLRGSGIRTVYYIPPGCWSRHRAPGELPFLVDAIATPFPWSAENFRAANAPARIEWVGHPLLEYSSSKWRREDARRSLQIEENRPVVALVPGSRRTEIQYLMPVFIEAVRRITPAPRCLLAVASSIGETPLRKMMPDDLEVQYLDGLDYRHIPAADAALVASGTATLELACLSIPMVVAYRGSFASWLQYQVLVRTGKLQHVALPNLLCDAGIVPELLGEHATPSALAAAVTPLLRETPERQAQLAAFARIRGWLGDGETCAHTARLVLETAVSPAPGRI